MGVEMDIHDKTRYKFASSIKKLMVHQPVDKITVTDIVQDSGMTRQTFYRYFKDKYDLVNWYFEKLAEKSIKQMGKDCSLKEALMKKFYFIKEEHVFFTQAFKSNDYNSLVQYDFECIFQFYKESIESSKQEELALSDRFLLEMYCRGSVDMTVNWVLQGMPLSIDEITDLLIEAMPEKLQPYLLEITS